MKVIAVDPDPVELIRLSESIRKTAPPGTSVECFHDPLFVYQYAEENPVDALYAVADMKRLGGIDIARQLKKRDPCIQVYLIWDNDDYKTAAQHMGADGYLIRPVTPDKLMKAGADRG